MNKFRDFLSRRMIPEIDAVPFDERQTADLGEDWIDHVKALAPRACDLLRPHFGDALQLHGIPDLIQGLIPGLDLTRICARTALVYASLDFFYARECPPTIKDLQRRHPVADKLLIYLRQRALDSITLNFAKMMSWLVVLRGIPERWVPAEQISRRLKAMVRATIEPSELEVTLDLRVPPGGKAWLRRSSLAAFAELQEHRRNRHPQAAAILIECANQTDILPIVVVQCGAGSSRGFVRFFDPFWPHKVRFLQFDMLSGELRSDTPSVHDIRGLMTLCFQAHDPAFSTLQRLQARCHVASLTWYFSRLWRLAARQR